MIPEFEPCDSDCEECFCAKDWELNDVVDYSCDCECHDFDELYKSDEKSARLKDTFGSDSDSDKSS